MISDAKVIKPEDDGKKLKQLRSTEKHQVVEPNCRYINDSHFEIQVQTMINQIKLMFPEEATRNCTQTIRHIAKQSYILADEIYSAKDAEAWGQGFEVDSKLVDSDERLFKASMRDIVVMTKRRQTLLKPNRLNRERVETHIHIHNPEKERLLLLAEKGMPMLLRPGFVANGAGPLPPLRKTYLAVKSAVNRLLVENFHKPGLAFILTKQTALDIPGIHFSPLHWTEKQGKRQGRPIGDCSDGGSEFNNEPLNSIYTKEQSDNLWGVIKHPSINKATIMVINYYNKVVKEDPTVEWNDIILCKKDMRAAFTLLFFDADGVQNLAMEMTDNKVIIFICGIFGWTGTPAAFQVITRALEHELQIALHGDVTMYADDILIVTLRKYLTEDMAATDAICNNLMGPNSVETTKTETGRIITFIGYDIDLDKKMVTISERNILRSLYGFLNVDLNAPIRVKTLQKLASWASRYSSICAYMKPFVSILYAEYAGRGEHVTVALSKRARRVICCFRVLLGLTAVNSIKFARPFESYQVNDSNITIEFDASLTGIGLLYYKTVQEKEVIIGGGSIDISILNFQSNPSYQNTAEFMAAILGIRGLRQLHLNPRNVRLRGDSITALTWAESGKFKGELAGNASVIFILQGIYENVTVSSVMHLSAADNWRTDYLSRGGTIAGLKERDINLGILTTVELNNDEVIALCNPNLPTNSEEEFNKFWINARRVLDPNF